MGYTRSTLAQNDLATSISLDIRLFISEEGDGSKLENVVVILRGV